MDLWMLDSPLVKFVLEEPAKLTLTWMSALTSYSTNVQALSAMQCGLTTVEAMPIHIIITLACIVTITSLQVDIPL
jgi:hypothetical protein